VGSGEDMTEGRAAEDPAVHATLDEVGEVRAAAAEQRDCEGHIAAGDVLGEVAGDAVVVDTSRDSRRHDGRQYRLAGGGRQQGGR
jgi:hypothetical protein